MQESILDIKSKPIYDKWWQMYTSFCKENKLDFISFSSFLDFIRVLSESYKYSTLWQASSCLNKYMKVMHNKDFQKEECFKAFMKKLGRNYVPVKSSVLTLDDVVLCIETGHLAIEVKVAIIIGVYGGLRLSELVEMEFGDVVMENGVCKVNVRKSKTDPGGKGHTFYVAPSATAGRCPVSVLQSYFELFPPDQRKGRFFRMVSNGRGLRRPIGKNTLASYPKICAEFLGKDDIESFTGHCFRGTSATIVADCGASMMTLKRHGRWKSDAVAQGYVANSKVAKMEVCNMLSGGETASTSKNDSVSRSSLNLSSGSSSSAFSIMNCSFSNCVVNFHGDQH